MLDVGEPDGSPVPRTISAVRPHKGRLLVLFEEITDRNGAEALRGSLLSILASHAAPAEEGRYYAHQLEGLRVVDEAGADLGVMTAVLENPANDLWVVRAGNRDVLVPAVKEIVRDVDLEHGRIVLRPVPGLFD